MTRSPPTGLSAVRPRLITAVSLATGARSAVLDIRVLVVRIFTVAPQVVTVVLPLLSLVTSRTCACPDAGLAFVTVPFSQPTAPRALLSVIAPSVAPATPPGAVQATSFSAPALPSSPPIVFPPRHSPRILVPLTWVTLSLPFTRTAPTQVGVLSPGGDSASGCRHRSSA